jgi:hypothetical protein
MIAPEIAQQAGDDTLANATPDTSRAKYVVRILGPDQFPAWDALVSESEQGAVFHTTRWLGASLITISDFWLLSPRFSGGVGASLHVSLRLTDLDTVWKNMTDKWRNDIRKTKEHKARATQDKKSAG